MLRLFLFSLLIFTAPALADSVYGDASPGPLVGEFSSDLQGTFVDVVYNDSAATITTSDGVIELELELGAPEIDGPVADFGNMQVHDNAYGWVHIQGEFRMRVYVYELVHRGFFVDPFWVVGIDIEWTTDGEWLVINAADALISNSPAFQTDGPEPGAWALLQGGDGSIMDWMAFAGAPFKTDSLGDEVVMDWVGTLGNDQPDLLIRLEDANHFDATPDRFVMRAGSVAAANVPASDLQNLRGGFSFNSTTTTHHILHVRLPEGMSGEVRWQQDLQTPTVVQQDLRNITPYAPLEQIPELDVQWNEPVWATLFIGDQEKRSIQPAESIKFRLTGLQPETTYTYRLHAQDLAGNTIVTTDTLTTGPAGGPTVQIHVVAIDETPAGHRVVFEALQGDGTPVPQSAVQLFVDKRAASQLVQFNDGVFEAMVPLDSSEARIEVQWLGSRVDEVIRFETVETSALAVAPLALALLAIARRR